MILILCVSQIGQNVTMLRAIFSPPIHTAVAIFELICLFDRRMMPWKFYDDISNGSRVITICWQTSKQMDTAENVVTVAVHYAL